MSPFDALEEAVETLYHIDERDRDPRSEFDRQRALLSALHRQAPAIDVIAIPNAGRGTDWERVRRFNEGARAGALDLLLVWDPTLPNHRGVAFIEMKSGTGMPDKNQHDRLNRYCRMGHNAAVFRQEGSAIAWLRSIGAPFLGIAA